MQQPVSLPSIRELFPNHNFSDSLNRSDREPLSSARSTHQPSTSPTAVSHTSHPHPYSPSTSSSSGPWALDSPVPYPPSASSSRPTYQYPPPSPYSPVFSTGGLPSPSSYDDDYYYRHRSRTASTAVDRRKGVVPRRSHGDLQQQHYAKIEPDVRKHKCTQCSKCFNRPSSLRIHINTHTGATPFQCPYPDCGRLFNVNSNMRRHYRNHRPVIGNANAQLASSESGDEEEEMSEVSEGEAPPPASN